MSKTKFNGFEKWLIEQAVTEWTRLAENEAIEAQNKGINLIFAPGYSEMVSKELLHKVNGMTLKRYAD